MLETESGKNSTVGKIIWLCLVKKFRSKFSAAQIKVLTVLNPSFGVKYKDIEKILPREMRCIGGVSL